MKKYIFIERVKKGSFFGFGIMYLMIFTLYPISPLYSIGMNEVHKESREIPEKYRSAITRIKTQHIEPGSVISEHINVKENGQTTVKMLEIPEHQLADLIEKWEKLGKKIDENTIHLDEFILYLLNNANVRSFSYMAKVPRFFFLVKKELPVPVLYGGEIKKFCKTLSFPGWFRVAGALDAQGNYTEGFEHLDAEKEDLIGLFTYVLSNTGKGSYTIVELFTDERGERKGLFKFFKRYEESMPTFVQSIDAMAAFGLIYMNLVQDNPADIGVKEDLTKPIVERLITKADLSQNAVVLLEEKEKKPFYPDS